MAKVIAGMTMSIDVPVLSFGPHRRATHTPATRSAGTRRPR